jgi:hypothetical protein
MSISTKVIRTGATSGIYIARDKFGKIHPIVSTIRHGKKITVGKCIVSYRTNSGMRVYK